MDWHFVAGVVVGVVVGLGGLFVAIRYGAGGVNL